MLLGIKTNGWFPEPEIRLIVRRRTCIGGVGVRTGSSSSSDRTDGRGLCCSPRLCAATQDGACPGVRARIVLGCAAGLSNKAVAARERLAAQTVGKWRRRFVERDQNRRCHSANHPTVLPRSLAAIP